MTSANDMPPARSLLGPLVRLVAAMLVTAAPLAALAQGTLQARTGAAQVPRIGNFLKKVQVTLPIVRDTDGGETRAWKVRITPSSFVVDRSDAVRHVLIGTMDWSTPEVEETLRALLPSSRADATPRQTSPQACVADAHARRAVPRRGRLNRSKYPMQRRALLKAAPAAGTVAAAKPIVVCAQAKGWRSYEVSARLEIAQAKGAVHAWMPLPLSQDTDYFKTFANSWSGNAERAEIVHEPAYRAAMVSAFFKPGETQPVLDVISRFAVRERRVDLKAGAGMLASREEQALYLKPTELMPIDGIAKKTADEITKGARADVQKARAIYERTVENTFRNAKTRCCGAGDVKVMLETRAPSGKCADLNALFVALCRAAGVPARDVYGVRVAESPRGYKSMGKLGDITAAQHCRTEFYAQDVGWVPIDRADVGKVVLEEWPSLTLADDVVRQMRTFLFGNWEGNWLAYNDAHDIKLPGSKGALVAFLLYPQAENADGRLDSLDPDNFRYRIASREIA